MITIIDNKIQINTRLLGGSNSYEPINFNSSGHTIVESGKILNIQGQDSNILDERQLTGMIIAKPGSVVIFKNLHIKESMFHDSFTSNPENKNDSKKRDYYKMYNQVKQKIVYKKEYLDKLLNTEIMRLFYNESDIEFFYSKYKTV